jgi:hypothetical protein
MRVKPNRPVAPSHDALDSGDAASERVTRLTAVVAAAPGHGVTGHGVTGHGVTGRPIGMDHPAEHPYTVGGGDFGEEQGV